jgi:hypothetical protein
MPDLANRRKYEDELAAALLLVWERNKGNWGPLERGVKDSLGLTLSKSYSDAAHNMGLSVMGLNRKNIDADEVRTAAGKWATARANELAKDIVQTTKDMGDLDDARAAMIAATEITGSVSAGEAGAAAFLATKGTGKYTAKWRTEDDALVCEICEPLNGASVEVYGDVSPSGPPAHPNCRCWLEYEEK